MDVITERNGAVWTVIINRPEARNAVNRDTADRLVAAFTEFDRDERAAAAVLDAVGARAVPRHPDEERAVVAVVGRPPFLRRRHHGLDVPLQGVEVEGLELGCVVEVLAHRIGLSGMLVQQFEL
jgi:hypothetical protein